VSGDIDRRFTRDGEVVTVRSDLSGAMACFDVVTQVICRVVPDIEARGSAKHTTLVIRVPAGLTAVERRALLNAAEHTGLRRLVLLEDAA
jgi:rod shape-determining protein MreB